MCGYGYELLLPSMVTIVNVICYTSMPDSSSGLETAALTVNERETEERLRKQMNFSKSLLTTNVGELLIVRKM